MSAREYYCALCGEKFTSSKYFPGFYDQQCDDCLRNNPPRGSRLTPHVAPEWLKTAVNV
jgi:hypothetical protein